MIAIKVTMGTKYDCNFDHKRDQLWLQSRSRKGPNMTAILVTKRTLFECNVDHNKDLIWLQCWLKKGLNMMQCHFWIGQYMFAISFQRDIIWLECLNSSWNHVTMISGQIVWKQIFDDCNHIRSFLWSTLHSYLVLLKLKIAIILGPFLTEIAIIIGSFCDQHCNHI